VKQGGGTLEARKFAQSGPGHGSPRQSRGRRCAPAYKQSWDVVTWCGVHDARYVFQDAVALGSAIGRGQCANLDCDTVVTRNCRVLVNGHNDAIQFKVSIRQTRCSKIMSSIILATSASAFERADSIAQSIRAMLHSIAQTKRVQSRRLALGLLQHCTWRGAAPWSLAGQFKSFGSARLADCCTTAYWYQQLLHCMQKHQPAECAMRVAAQSLLPRRCAAAAGPCFSCCCCLPCCSGRIS
jgi:hypothetical protein